MRLSHLLAGLALAASLQPLPGIARAHALPHAEAAAAQAPAPGDGAGEERPPQPVRPLATFLADLDYPAEAIARREEGSVRIRLSIDREGRVAGCSVLASSGSSALDVAGCQLLGQRARFHPARDARGEPVSGTYTTAITWVLPSGGLGSAVEIAYQAWIDCALAESARHAHTALSLRDVTRRAMARCAREESEATRAIGTELELIPARNSIHRAIAHQIGQLRRRPPRSAPAAPQKR